MLHKDHKVIDNKNLLHKASNMNHHYVCKENLHHCNLHDHQDRNLNNLHLKRESIKTGLN